MKALVGIDGSERSYHAVHFAGRLLSPLCDDLVLYFATPHFKLAAGSAVEDEVHAMASKALADSVFAKGLEQLPDELRPLATQVVGEDRPVEGILAAAAEAKADLIVMGAHGDSKKLHLFLGGTARSVSHRAQIPVLVARESERSAAGPLKVLVACGDDRNWLAATDALCGVCWPDDTSGNLLHVVDTMDQEYLVELANDPHPSVPNAAILIQEYQDAIALRKGQCKKMLTSMMAGLPSIFRDATPEIVQGHVVEEIIRKVHEDQIDLVVVGARKLGPIGRLLGSTTESLLSHCPCSLLIVHQQES